MNSPEFPKGATGAWLLLVCAMLLWGVNWPIMKLGLAYSDPLWFATFRAALAGLTLFAVLGMMGRLRLPAREDWIILISIGGIQVGLCMTLIHASVQFASAGQAAMLAYTTPIWAAPMALLVLGERLHWPRRLSLVLGLAGLAVLMLPLLSNPSLSGRDDWLGIGLPVASAVLWAGAIVHVRAHRWNRPLIGLMPWQFLIGAGVQSILAVFLMGPPAVQWTPDMLWIMFYNVVPATVLAFWAYLSAARRLPATATAMGSLGIPLVGLVSAALVLGETLTAAETLAVLLLASGIALSALR